MFAIDGMPTANPHLLPPNSSAMIGHSDQANHRYDLTDFWNAAEPGILPAASSLRPLHINKDIPDTLTN
jgi:hypothetical protein